MSAAKIPEFVWCRGCKRNIDVRSYQGYPDANVPPEKVTEIVDPTSPPFGVACSCGHYTMSRPQARSKRGDR